MMKTRYGTIIIMVALLTLPGFAKSEESPGIRLKTPYSCIVSSSQKRKTHVSAEFAVPEIDEPEGHICLDRHFSEAFFASLNLGEWSHLQRSQGWAACSPRYSKHPSESYAKVEARWSRKWGWNVVETNWAPEAEMVEMARKCYPKPFIPPQDAPVDLFSPKAYDAMKTWMERNDIALTADAQSTLALMLQTALALQNFDPGPRDGKIGPKTLAAIAAWQAIVGLLAGTDLVDLLAAILHTAMTLQGLDPGPVHTMFGQSALDTVAAWQTAHGSALAEVQRAQPGYGEEIDDRLLSSSWRRVPDALACVSVDYSERRFTQFIVNHCDHPVRVE